MAKTFEQNGDTMTWTNDSGADVASGDVVIVGSQLGVALTDIANGETGELAMTGVWRCPKVSAAVIAAGEFLVWDVSASAFDDDAATPATGDVSKAATAWEAAGNGVTTIACKINVGVGVVA